MPDYRDYVIPKGPAKSKAQWRYFKDIYDQLPPGDTHRRRIFLDALDVNYDSLPERVETPAPKTSPKPQAKAQRNPAEGLRFPPHGYATPLELFTHNGVNLTPEQRDSLKRLGYVVKAPGMGIMGLVTNPEQRARFRERVSFIKHVWTLSEAAGLLALDGEVVAKLKQAAELLASPAPAEPTMKPPPTAEKPWLDDPDPFSDSEYEAEDDSDVFN
jgi:hypothetical protein